MAIELVLVAAASAVLLAEVARRWLLGRVFERSLIDLKASVVVFPELSESQSGGIPPHVGKISA